MPYRQLSELMKHAGEVLYEHLLAAVRGHNLQCSELKTHFCCFGTVSEVVKVNVPIKSTKPQNQEI